MLVPSGTIYIRHGSQPRGRRFAKPQSKTINANTSVVNGNFSANRRLGSVVSGPTRQAILDKRVEEGR